MDSIEVDNHRVVLIPYVLSEEGVIQSIMLKQTEKRTYPIYSDHKVSTSMFRSAMDMQEAIFNIAITDNDKWKYLGTITSTEEYNNTIYHLYAINITDISYTNSSGEYSLMNATDILKQSNSLLLASFIRLYREVWKAKD